MTEELDVLTRFGLIEDLINRNKEKLFTAQVDQSEDSVIEPIRQEIDRLVVMREELHPEAKELFTAISAFGPLQGWSNKIPDQPT